MALKKSKAKKSLKKARAGKSKDASFVKKQLEEAMGLHRQGKLDDAERIYREVLSLQANNDEALHLLGVLVSQKGDHEKALELIGQAIKENPQVAQYHDNLGVVHMRLGNAEQAAACHRKATEIDPRYAMAYHNLGVAQDTLMDLSSSLESFKKAASLNPQNADTLDSLGAVLSKLGHEVKALEYHKRALSINPHLARAFGNVAGILNKHGKADEAFDVYRQQLKLDPKNFDAYYALAELSLKRMDSVAALQYVEQALEQKPDDAAACLKRLEIYSKTMMWDKIDELLPGFIRLVKKQFGSGKLAKAEPFAALPLDLPLDVIRALASERAMRIKAEAPPLEFTYRKPEDQKLRIAYLSADFSSHAVGFLVNDLYALHDKEKFEIYCYSLRRVEDEFRSSIKNASDNFIDLDGLSHEEAARRINADGINILVDLSGYTAHGRPQILALQPAPVQCHAIGYPGTMGADFVQYYITNPACVPSEMQSAFSEKLVYLPETQFAAGAFDIPDPEIKRSDYGLPEDAFVFCCFNHAYRINRKVFESWLEILRQTPRSILWLKSHGDDMEQRLRDYAAAKGIDAERIIFAKIGLLSERWPQRLADLWLDTFNLSAGTAGFMAAWAGLPSLTLKGPTPQSRTGVNNVLACHLPQMLAESVDEYIEKAVYYASNRDKLQELKRHLLDEREQLPIFDRKTYVSNLESAYLQMWQRYEGNLEPEHINVLPGNMGDNSKDICTYAGKLESQGNLESAEVVLDGHVSVGEATTQDKIALAKIRRLRGKSNQALELLEAIPETEPDFSTALSEMAFCHQSMGDKQKAIECFENSLAIASDDSLVPYELAKLLVQRGEYKRSIEYYKQTISLRNDDAEIYARLGDAYNLSGEVGNALENYRKAIQIEPNDYKLHLLLGAYLFDKKYRDEGLERLQEAHRLNPQSLNVLMKMTQAYSQLSMFEEWERSKVAISDIVESGHATDALGDMGPFVAMCADLPLHVIKDIAQKRSEYFEKEARGNVFSHVPRVKDRLKIAYISPDLNAHAVGFILGDTLRLHDRNVFDIYAYSLESGIDSYTEKIRGSVDGYYDLSALPYEDAAAKIKADEIDILVDLAGYTAKARTGILARKPAAIQCHAVGYPGTMGGSFMDYYITSKYCVSEDARNYFKESLVYLPETQFATGPFDMSNASGSRADYGLPDDAFVFACFNGAYRIDRRVFMAWMEILKRVPDSLLWLKDANEHMKRNLYEQAKLVGIEAERLVFSSFGALSQSWPQRLADLWLDTFNLSAGTAGFMAAWAGLPSLTLKGPTPQSCTGVNNVLACHLPQMLADNIDEYIEKAVYYASNRDKLQELKRHLLDNREQLPIFDRQRYIWHLEDAYREMWRIHLEGLKPHDIALDARPL